MSSVLSSLYAKTSQSIDVINASQQKCLTEVVLVVCSLVGSFLVIMYWMWVHQQQEWADVQQQTIRDAFEHSSDDRSLKVPSRTPHTSKFGPGPLEDTEVPTGHHEIPIEYPEDHVAPQEDPVDYPEDTVEDPTTFVHGLPTPVKSPSKPTAVASGRPNRAIPVRRTPSPSSSVVQAIVDTVVVGASKFWHSLTGAPPPEQDWLRACFCGRLHGEPDNDLGCRDRPVDRRRFIRERDQLRKECHIERERSRS
jgi:hypothetical protein